MQDKTSVTMSRRGLLFGVFATVGVAASSRAMAAPALLSGAGDIRMVNLVNPRTGDRLKAVYWVEGRYVPEVLAEIDYLMRDWRVDAVRPIAPETIDIIAAAHKLLDAAEPFAVYSGYRTPETNRQLRRRSRAVARNSYHVKGMAADLHLETRSVRQMAAAAQSLNAGGVGLYSRSAFVHMDSGPVRHWGR